MHFEQLKKLRKEIYQIAAKYRIKQVYVFGSVARGDETNLSDVDFLIEMENGASAFGWVHSSLKCKNYWGFKLMWCLPLRSPMLMIRILSSRCNVRRLRYNLGHHAARFGSP